MGLKAVISLREADNIIRNNVKLTLTRSHDCVWGMQPVKNISYFILKAKKERKKRKKERNTLRRKGSISAMYLEPLKGSIHS